jgi:excisionase family DNA binding protein
MKNTSDVGVRMPTDCTCVRRAAKELECTTRTVRRYIRDGKIRAQRIGERFWAVSRADVTLLALRRT